MRLLEDADTVWQRKKHCLTFVGEGKAWCHTEALWLPLAWTSTDGGCVVPHVRTSLACCLRLRAECLLRGAEQPQTSLKSLDRAPSYLMRWSCTIYTLRTYVCCTISANIFVSTLFKKQNVRTFVGSNHKTELTDPSLSYSVTNSFPFNRLWNVNGTGHFQKLVLFGW